MRGPLDMRGGLLVAAEPRGDCNMWRLAKGFWDVVGELEGRQCMGGGDMGGMVVVGMWVEWRWGLFLF